MTRVNRGSVQLVEQVLHRGDGGTLTCRRGHRSAQPAQCADDPAWGHQTYRSMVDNSGYAAGFRRPGRNRLMLVNAGAWALAITLSDGHVAAVSPVSHTLR